MSSLATDTGDIALLYTKWANKPVYMELLKERGMPVVDADELAEADWQRVTFATVWSPPAGLLAKCPNLRVVQSLGAGVDSLLAAGQVPQELPITRIVDPLMAQRMATWVVWGVISWQRKMEDYAAAQRSCQWAVDIEARGSNRDNAEVAVGVMGLGVMGQATAKQLLAMGYQVSGWSRSSSSHSECTAAGISCYAGQQQLEMFVRAQDVLVCLLPLTPETTGIINAQLLSWLRPGSAVINGGRGRQLIEADLLGALDSGQVDFALLDVFDHEPLPPTSRLWSHPRVRITPHVASMTTMETAADQIAANYHSVAAGKGPLEANLVDRNRGY
ncbi:hypothetical protein OEZ85_001422 [Tetradesmus obliquus]|uniref:D-isomer specific 2-hydroxyacid dehydrogenase NAD-binding domain-containing protein n=1 Tax=Tetradesmus obliquus TaxID=3088 RepID=A0ABY8UNE3_TETOB|nr:hypothetical protein OEZ85_001422 [Tetradesmus obliquus]